MEKPAPGREDVPLTLTNMADPAHFRTMRIPIVAGRAPSDEDRAGGLAVAVINQEIAHRWWKDAHSAIGQHIKIGGPYQEGGVLEIVGVAANVPQMGLDSPPLPEIYFPSAQKVSPAMVVAIRTRGTPESMTRTVRQTLLSIDSNVPIQSLKLAPGIVIGKDAIAAIGSVIWASIPHGEVYGGNPATLRGVRTFASEEREDRFK